MSSGLAIGRLTPGWCAAASLALLISAVDTSTAMADCVQGLALCAMECDQRTKPETPERPQCARSCVSNYQRCERIEVFQSTTGGGVLNRGKTLAPAQ